MTVTCGGGNIGAVCDAGASKVFENCDQNNSDDIETLQSAFALFEIFLTESEIMDATESDVRSECEDLLNEDEVEISNENKDIFINEVNGTQTCEETVAVIVDGVNDLSEDYSSGTAATPSRMHSSP